MIVELRAVCWCNWYIFRPWRHSFILTYRPDSLALVLLSFEFNINSVQKKKKEKKKPSVCFELICYRHGYQEWRYKLVVCQMDTAFRRAVPSGNVFLRFLQCRILGGGIFRPELPSEILSSLKTLVGAALKSKAVQHFFYCRDLWLNLRQKQENWRNGTFG